MTDKFCPKCDRITSHNICIVHGKVDAYENELLSKLYKIITAVIKDVENTDYARPEIKSKAIHDIKKLLEKHELLREKDL